MDLERAFLEPITQNGRIGQTWPIHTKNAWFQNKVLTCLFF